MAQLRWDASAAAGVEQRFLTGAQSGSASPRPGATGELQAHVAVFPMVRVGPYLSHSIAPLSEGPARQITAAGLTAKVSPPILALPWSPWAFIGVGYARTYRPSHEVTGAGAGPLAFVPGQGGGFLEARAGVGLGVHLSRSWEAFAELGGRFGLLFTGSVYEAGVGASGAAQEPAGASCAAQEPVRCAEPFAGKDSFALALTLGLSLNE